MIRKLKAQRMILLLLIIACIFVNLIYKIKKEAEILLLSQEVYLLTEELEYKKSEVEVCKAIVEENSRLTNQKTINVDEKEYTGEFEITYYTAGFESTGKHPGHPAYGITKSGTTVEEGRTIAADWDILPEGTKVYIEGIGERIVEDTGSAIIDKCIDVYVEDLEAARELGRHKADVYILND